MRSLPTHEDVKRRFQRIVRTQLGYHHGQIELVAELINALRRWLFLDWYVVSWRTNADPNQHHVCFVLKHLWAEFVRAQKTGVDGIKRRSLHILVPHDLEKWSHAVCLDESSEGSSMRKRTGRFKWKLPRVAEIRGIFQRRVKGFPTLHAKGCCMSFMSFWIKVQPRFAEEFSPASSSAIVESQTRTTQNGPQSPNRGNMPATDRSALLTKLVYQNDADGIHQILSPQPYEYALMDSTRQMLGTVGVEDLQRLVRNAMPIILDNAKKDPKTAQTMTTILKTNFVRLKGCFSSVELRKMMEICSEGMRKDDLRIVAVASPLSFFLATQGFKEIHLQMLRACVDRRPWRHEELKRMSAYYGKFAVMLNSFRRHSNDRLRSAQLKANNVGRLIALLEDGHPGIEEEGNREMIIHLMKKALREIRCSGDHDLVAKASKLIEKQSFCCR